MKKLIVISAISFICCSAFAQDSSADMKDTSMSKMGHMKKDCVMKKDGKVMVMKNGNSMMLDNTITLNNGTMVMKDGTVKMTDGTTKMLKDGQYVDMDGKMGMMKMKMKKE